MLRQCLPHRVTAALADGRASILSRASSTNLRDALNLATHAVAPPPPRKTKLVCTVGPASLHRLPEMINAGMDCARVNMAHGDADEYRRIVAAVRAAAAAAAPTRLDASAVAIAFDVKGPEIR